VPPVAPQTAAETDTPIESPSPASETPDANKTEPRASAHAIARDDVPVPDSVLLQAPGAETEPIRPEPSQPDGVPADLVPTGYEPGPAPREALPAADSEPDLSDRSDSSDSCDSSEPAHGGWQQVASAHDLAVELRRVESCIRDLLAQGDIKRKRKYEGTRRWLELEEDILIMRFQGPAREETLREVLRLIAQRRRIFRRLNFLVSTRHCLNT